MTDAWPSTAAYFTDRNQNVVMVNDPARAVMPGNWACGANRVSLIFGDEWRAADLEWERTARHAVAALRFHGHPADPQYSDLVRYMTIRDSDFRAMWAAHEAAPLESGQMRLQTHESGDLTLTQHAVRPPGLDDHVLIILRGELASPVSAEPMAMGARQ